MEEGEDAVAPAGWCWRCLATYRRHRWALLVPLVLGLCGAALASVHHLHRYTSEAVVLLRPHAEAPRISPVDAPADVTFPEVTEGEFLNAEIEVARSQSVLVEAAEKLGPEKAGVPVGASALTNPLAQATASMRRGLDIRANEGAPVLRFTFTHSDPQIAQDILNEVVNAYLTKRRDLRRGVGGGDFVSQRSEIARGRLNSVEAESKRLRSEAGITDLASARDALNRRSDQLRSAIRETEVELAVLDATTAILAEVAEVADPAEKDAIAPQMREREIAQAGLVAKKETLESQAAILEEEQLRYIDIATRLESIGRTREMEVANVRRWEAKLDQAKLEEALDPRLDPSAAVIQSPTPGTRDDRAIARSVTLILGLGLTTGLLLPWILANAGRTTSKQHPDPGSGTP